ncbi:hemerythrin domain-containing protein [Chryseobacterium timonianum]|uniref:hemerythrin domain-containing protein n=1 Tax=Chryseobacterium timonianum TaxID=1805473 RepID=UPI001F4A4EA1|nr:hemerythrin domain-containing protein [Chryseobacterium timonianum]
MKRNENLMLLSRDHHFGLLCCWKIREGIKKNIAYERIRDYVIYFWEYHLSDHFDIEDNVLPEAPEESLQRQLNGEHGEIRKLVKCISQSGNLQLLSAFASALKSHIRFEERTLFPHLEEMLGNPSLNEIGKQLRDLHKPLGEEYADEFWK